MCQVSCCFFFCCTDCDCRALRSPAIGISSFLLLNRAFSSFRRDESAIGNWIAMLPGKLSLNDKLAKYFLPLRPLASDWSQMPVLPAVKRVASHDNTSDSSNFECLHKEYFAEHHPASRPS